MADGLNENLASELEEVFAPDEFIRDGIWLRVRMDRLSPDLCTGWKLHLSATPATMKPLLRAALPALERFGLPFKVICSMDLIEELNDGRFGLTQVGKAITIYAPDEPAAAAAAEVLRGELRGFQGPAIPTDFRLFDDAPVFCRFGAFDGRFEIDALGQKRRLLRHPDLGDVIDPADGGDTPLPEPLILPHRPAPDHLAFLRDRFLILRMLHLSAKGGVFLALPRREKSRGPVLIKTARYGTNSDRLNRDALWAMKREHEFLRLLAGMPGVPDAGELLCDGDQTSALVRSWIDGKTLWELWTLPNAATQQSRRSLAVTLGELLDRVAAIHASGVLVRDLSPANILLSAEGVTILDWEMAQAVAEDSPGYRRGTPGFYDAERDRFRVPAPADDFGALLALAFMAETGVHPALLPQGATRHPVTAIACTRSFQTAFQDAANCVDNGPKFHSTYRVLLDKVGSPREEAFAVSDASHLEGRFRDDIEQTFAKASRPGCDHEDLTVYSGLAGLLLVAIECGPDRLLGDMPPDRLIAGCARMIAPAGTVRHIPGLYFGEPGVALAVAVAGTYLDAPHLVDSARAVLESFDPGQHRVPDVCHGLAGYALAALGAWDATGLDPFRERALRAGERLLALANEGEQGVYWPWPEGPYGSLSGARLFGFAHGVAGVTYTLLRLYEAFDLPVFRDGSVQGLETLARGAAALDDGRGHWWPFSDGDATCWNAWCHGTPGVVKALARAVGVMGRNADRTLLNLALTGVASANNAGFCLCHGIASRLDAYADAKEYNAAHVASARRDAAILSALDTYALESCAHGLEAAGRSRGLMTGAAGVYRTLARYADTVRGPFGLLLP